jgi:DNA-binding XRE family transcriptional regulator
MKKTTKKHARQRHEFEVPEPVGQIEIEGHQHQVVVIPSDVWEEVIELIEDYNDLRDHKAIMNDPKSVFIPLEEAEKNWFDNNIKKIRKKKKITQKEFAKRMRVSQARISRIENPDYRPSAGVYERAAKALGCGLNDLI